MTRDEQIKAVCETLIGFSNKSDHEIIEAVKAARELLAEMEEKPKPCKCHPLEKVYHGCRCGAKGGNGGEETA